MASAAPTDLRQTVLNRVLGPDGERDFTRPIDIKGLDRNVRPLVRKIAEALSTDRHEPRAITGIELAQVLTALESASASRVTGTRGPSSAIAVFSEAQIKRAISRSQATAIDSKMAMPPEMVTFMRNQMWPQMHLEWHAIRRKDANAALIAKMHWTPAKFQEGDVGNGWDFGMMHRAMRQILLEKFPQHADLLHGWTQVPTDVNSTSDPHVPGTPPLDPRAATAIGLLQSMKQNWASFSSMDDDAFLRFIETSIVGTGANPWDKALGMPGLHNYLHNWFQNPKSPFDMGDPTKNLFNQEFWRLHGWIDALWTQFRSLKGEVDDNSTKEGQQYNQDLAAAKKAMNMSMMSGTHAKPRSLPAKASFPNFFEQPSG
jgi:hypothetical protein